MAVVAAGLICLAGVDVLALGQEIRACQAAASIAASGAPAAAGGLAGLATAAGDPGWPSFLAALREQETGSPAGDYAENVPGCQGAYCWRDSGVWRSTATGAGVDLSAYPTASDAPPAVQDAVVTTYLFRIYQEAGGGQAGYREAAAAWNGGTTAVRANPALGPGATNYTYAGEVVAKMDGLAGSTHGGSRANGGTCGAGPWSTVAYLNPLRAVKGLVPGRIDQGVDYRGSGPVYALGPGVVTSVYNAGWPDGVFLTYELTGGPDSARGVYVAENLVPQVRVGQAVGPTTVLATLRPEHPDLETGWADLRVLGMSEAMADHQAATTGDAGRISTGCGQNFDALLQALGAPGGALQPGSVAQSGCR